MPETRSFGENFDLYKDGMEINRFIELQNNETLAKALQRLVD